MFLGVWDEIRVLIVRQEEVCSTEKEPGLQKVPSSWRTQTVKVDCCPPHSGDAASRLQRTEVITMEDSGGHLEATPAKTLASRATRVLIPRIAASPWYLCLGQVRTWPGCPQTPRGSALAQTSPRGQPPTPPGHPTRQQVSWYSSRINLCKNERLM